MRRLAIILCASLLLGTGAAQESGGDPGIVFNEPVAWDDPDPWGGHPPPWFEDPSTVDCGGREACEASLENQTA